MQVLGVKFTVKELLVTGVASAVILYGIKEIAFAIDPELKEKVDVSSENNFVNSFFMDKIWTPITGIEQLPGAWIYDKINPKKETEYSLPNSGMSSEDLDFGNDSDGLAETELEDIANDPNWY